MNSQRRVKIQVWLLIVLVFALGGVTGAAIDRFFVRSAVDPSSASANRNGGPTRYINALKQDLNLSEEQTKSIREILDVNRKEFRGLMSECSGMTELRARTDSRIKALLSPEQQVRFDELQAHRNAEMNKK
jgi:hypothetical protein